MFITWIVVLCFRVCKCICVRVRGQRVKQHNKQRSDISIQLLCFGNWSWVVPCNTHTHTQSCSVFLSSRSCCGGDDEGNVIQIKGEAQGGSPYHHLFYAPRPNFNMDLLHVGPEIPTDRNSSPHGGFINRQSAAQCLVLHLVSSSPHWDSISAGLVGKTGEEDSG